MFLVYSRSCLPSIHWSQVLSWEWRCSWSSAGRRYSNYIWVINNFDAYTGATYIRGFRVGSGISVSWLMSRLSGATPSSQIIPYREASINMYTNTISYGENELKLIFQGYHYTSTNKTCTQTLHHIGEDELQLIFQSWITTGTISAHKKTSLSTKIFYNLYHTEVEWSIYT